MQHSHNSFFSSFFSYYFILLVLSCVSSSVCFILKCKPKTNRKREMNLILDLWALCAVEVLLYVIHCTCVKCKRKRLKIREMFVYVRMRTNESDYKKRRKYSWNRSYAYDFIKAFAHTFVLVHTQVHCLSSFLMQN